MRGQDAMSKQRMEDIIYEVLADDEQKNALDFVVFLRANNLQFEKAKDGYWQDKPYWLIKYEGEYVCFIFINGSPAKYTDESEGWAIWTETNDSYSSCYSNAQREQRMKDIALRNVDICANCDPAGSCAGGRRKMIFGKEFGNVCRCTFRFDNPNSEAVDCVRKLIVIRIKDIHENA